MSLEITEAEFQRLVKFMYDNFGINLNNKKVLIQGRLRNMLIDRGFKSYNDYIDSVLADTTGAEVNTILNKLTTNHTFFMREPEHYTFMNDVVLPYMEKTCASTHTIRMWSAACSSGEEVYTMAMLVDQYFKGEKGKWDTRILASDISQNVIGKAKAGIYTEDGMKGLSNEWKSRYFNKLSDGTYEICRSIKDEVIYKTFNLMDPMPDKYKKNPFDLIFCRNVMIYFDQPTKNALVERFFDVVKPGSYFFIGHAESVSRQDTRFEYIKPAIYRRPE